MDSPATTSISCEMTIFFLLVVSTLVNAECTAAQMRALVLSHIAFINDVDFFALRLLFTSTATMKVGVDIETAYVRPILTVSEWQCITKRATVDLILGGDTLKTFARDQIDFNVTYKVVALQPSVDLSFKTEIRMEFKQEGERCLIGHLWLPWTATNIGVILFNALIHECIVQ
jgi:hypothetical protein